MWRAGSGHDEDGPLRMEDGLGLDVVQAFQQGGADAHEPIVGAFDDRPGGDARRVARAGVRWLHRERRGHPPPRADRGAPTTQAAPRSDPQVVRDRLLDGGRRPRRIHRLAALGHRAHDEGGPDRAEARLHAGHRHERPGAGASRGCRAAPRVGLRGAGDPPHRPRPDRGGGHGRPSRSRRGRGTIPIPPTPGTPRGGSASPATAPRTSPRSTAWTRCRSATRSRCGPSTGRSTIT